PSARRRFSRRPEHPSARDLPRPDMPERRPPSGFGVCAWLIITEALLDSASMKGLVSFHPVDLAFFDELIAPLAAGRKVNPESFLQRAPRLRQTAWIARRYVIALEQLAVAA